MKAKRIAVHVAVLIVGLLAGLLLSGCASTRIKQVSGEEFMRQARGIELVSSFNWTSYVGCSSQRAYLEYGSAPFAFRGARTTVFWVPLSELPKDVAQKLRAGDPPWTPWLSRTNETERIIEVPAAK